MHIFLHNIVYVYAVIEYIITIDVMHVNFVWVCSRPMERSSEIRLQQLIEYVYAIHRIRVWSTLNTYMQYIQYTTARNCIFLRIKSCTFTQHIVCVYAIIRANFGLPYMKLSVRLPNNVYILTQWNKHFYAVAVSCLHKKLNKLTEYIWYIYAISFIRLQSTSNTFTEYIESVYKPKFIVWI